MLQTRILFISTLLFFISSFLKVQGQGPDCVWAVSFGDTAFDIVNSTMIDNDGNLYVSGEFEGTIDFDPGPGSYYLSSHGASDMFISKLDSGGNFIWVREVGGVYNDFGFDIAIDSASNIYTISASIDTVDVDPGPGVLNYNSQSSYMVISKLDSGGNFLWAKQFLGIAGYDGIALDSNRNIYATGVFVGTTDFDPDAGVFNITTQGSQVKTFILKLDPEGNFLWAKAIQDTSFNSSLSMAVDLSGNVYTTGFFSGTADFDPDSLATHYISTTAFEDLFLLKLNTNGEFVWVKVAHGTFYTQPWSIQADRYGYIYIGGEFRGIVDFDSTGGISPITATANPDIFIAKSDTSGNWIWVKQIGSAGMDVCYDIALDENGNIYTAGYFESTVDFDPGAGAFSLTSMGDRDIYVSKLDNSGNFIWARKFGGTGYDDAQSLSVNSTGEVYVTGEFLSPSVIFDSYQLNMPGASDIFIAKLDTMLITGSVEIENLSNNVILYPNPATNRFWILRGNNNHEMEITISDINGEEIYSGHSKNNDRLVIDIDSFSNGIYTVLIKVSNSSIVKKLVVLK